MGIKKHLRNSIATALLMGVWFSSPARAESERLDLLFEQLKEADVATAERIEGQIITEWSKSGSPAMDLLLRRAEEALDEGTPDVALQHFSALVDHAPDFAEGYHGRATAYYQMGMYGPAIDDLRETLVLEPRHFGAMTGVAVILEELDRPRDALEVWQLVHEIVPADMEVVAVIERLQVQLTGETL